MPQPISYKEFQNLVCTSARQYYDFLTENFNRGNLSSGTKVITIYRIAPGRIPGEYVLATSEKVTFPDACQIWVQGKYIPSIEILTTCGQSKGSHSIHIYDTKGYLSKIPGLRPEEIQIISDLRFLIKRLYAFYAKQNFSFFPVAPSDIPPLPCSYTTGLSNEQINAIETIFHSPVSYVSGAPGTGKTKAVLSRCILRYIFAKKRIILLAPTNNAVEQMLRGVLPILQDAGIDLECVYRFGTASEEFSKEYPQVVGDTSVESLLQSLLSQKAFFESQLQTAYTLHQKAQSAVGWYNSCSDIHTKICDLFAQIKDLDAQLLSESDTQNTARNAMDEAKTNLDSATTHVNEAYESMMDCDKSIFSLHNRIKKTKLWFWKKKQLQMLEEKLNDAVSNSALLSKKHAETVQEYNRCQAKWLDAKRSYESILATCQDFADRRLAILKEISNTASYDAGYSNAILPQISIPENAIAAGESYLRSLEAKLQKAVGLATSKPYIVIQSQLSETQKQLDSLGTSVKALQRKNALVLAGTIDSALTTLGTTSEEGQIEDESQKIHHVFLDEAGYTCLAKGMVAFSCGAPVTFLGDHKQLPPVCEMSSISPAFAPVCLWSLSIAYYSELVYEGFSNLYQNCYQRNMEPSFRDIEYCTLNTSYRFGPALADLLAKYIYSEKFRGIATAPFTIQIVNAPHHPGPIKNSSRSEAEAILSFLYANSCENIAILTPYRGQTKYLRDTLPKAYRDSILTVHRSQGCEWDTVILSVVDTFRPFFTDSSLLIGRSVLNTAISRAKHRLVIVCDTSEWVKRPNQLIRELIHCGEHINQ